MVIWFVFVLIYKNNLIFAQKNSIIDLYFLYFIKID